MKRKLLTFLGCFVFSLALIWSMIFAVDCYRCSHLMKPLFTVGITDTLADDGGSGTYRGLGYTVVVDGYLSAEAGYIAESVEMSFLGKTVAASIR